MVALARTRIYEFSRKSGRFYDVAQNSLRVDDDDDEARKSHLVFAAVI